jgi:hypothetical protein
MGGRVCAATLHMDPPLYVWYLGTRLIVSGGTRRKDRVEFRPHHFDRECVFRLRDSDEVPCRFTQKCIRMTTGVPEDKVTKTIHVYGWGDDPRHNVVRVIASEHNTIDEEVGPRAVYLSLDQWRAFVRLVALFLDVDHPARSDMGTALEFMPTFDHDSEFVMEFQTWRSDIDLPLHIWRGAARNPTWFHVLMASRRTEVPAQECAETAIKSEPSGAVLISILDIPEATAQLKFDMLVITAILARRPHALKALKGKCHDETVHRMCNAALEWFAAERFQVSIMADRIQFRW